MCVVSSQGNITRDVVSTWKYCDASRLKEVVLVMSNEALADYEGLSTDLDNLLEGLSRSKNDKDNK